MPSYWPRNCECGSWSISSLIQIALGKLSEWCSQEHCSTYYGSASCRLNWKVRSQKKHRYLFYRLLVVCWILPCLFSVVCILLYLQLAKVKLFSFISRASYKGYYHGFPTHSSGFEIQCPLQYYFEKHNSLQIVIIFDIWEYHPIVRIQAR